MLFIFAFAHFRDHVWQAWGKDNASTIAERRIGRRACSLVLPDGRDRLSEVKRDEAAASCGSENRTLKRQVRQVRNLPATT
ncbi:hypothetical protein [Mesorhizobium ventifaucium]|uniref:hypothetical protein n=1 Tax=Mesorhizobium ventifaucium TaxID=666020 RepID=UPI0020A76C43|nr:hypothetical protein [Mesorhizobium ventifaucium]